MALRALWDVTQQFQNKNGSNLTSGKIYIYYQGRTALATTYHDEDGTVVNSNPVLLDNNGRATAFADPIYSYTIVVCDYYGKELFSQDITLHDAISTAEDVVILGTDGTVLVDRAQLPNGVQYDLSVNTDIIATKQSVDDVKDDLDDLSDVVDNHTTQIGQLEDDVEDIETALTNKKDKQTALSFDGAATKTVKKITQNANGEMNVEFEDIDLPPEVPNVEITSEDNSIQVSESTDVQTNTKTFDLSVNVDDALEYGQFRATNVTTRATLNKIKGNLNLNNNAIALKKGNSYHFTLRGTYVPGTAANTYTNLTYIEYSAFQGINVNVDNTITDSQCFEISYDVYNLNSDIDYIVSFAASSGTVSELWVEVHNLNGVSINGSGGGESYTAGDAIDLTDNEISVKYGKGLTVNASNQLEIKAGRGLSFDADTLEVEIDSEVGDVVETVEKLKDDLDKKITTTYPFAQITSMSDFAQYGVTNTTRMIGQLFAVPIASEIRKDETVLCVNALQNFSGNVSFGIFEYDFEGNDGTGSTYWIADTGTVSVSAGENEFALKYVLNDAHELQSSKLYYAVIAVAANAPATGLLLGSSAAYAQNVNANPKYTLIVSNMDQAIDWSTGTLQGAWFQGYNEQYDIPRLFMMLRNGEGSTPIPVTEPFTNISSFTLQHQYRVSDIFSLTPDASGGVYRKVIPAQDVDITSFRYVDYHGSVPAQTSYPVLLDDTYTPMKAIGDGTWTLGDSDGTKIDGTHRVHEFTFTTPVHLTANTAYWFMVGGNLSDQGDDWLITYQTPSVSNDLLLVKNMYNVNSWIIPDSGEFLSSQPGMYLQLSDGTNSWTI